MGRTGAATYSDPYVFESPSLEIAASTKASAKLIFISLMPRGADPVYTANPYMPLNRQKPVNHSGPGAIPEIPLSRGKIVPALRFLWEIEGSVKGRLQERCAATVFLATYNGPQRTR